MNTWLACYLLGAVMLAWSLWIVDELADWYRILEIIFWPAAVLVGSVRKLKGG